MEFQSQVMMWENPSMLTVQLASEEDSTLVQVNDIRTPRGEMAQFSLIFDID